LSAKTRLGAATKHFDGGKKAKKEFSCAIAEVKSLLAEIEAARKEVAQLPVVREAAEKARKNVSTHALSWIPVNSNFPSLGRLNARPT
jgi:hypothetical protein